PPAPVPTPESSKPAASASTATTGDCPVAQVNDMPLYLSDLERISKSKEERLQPVPGEPKEKTVFQMRYQFLDHMVIRETLRQEAKLRKITATDSDVNEWMTKAGPFGKPETSGAMFAELAGLTEQQFKDQIRINLQVQKLVDQEVFNEKSLVS